jgi:uncharacterized protein involved in exopolysaccharide biosynthesis
MQPTRTSSWYLFVLLGNRWFLLKALLVIMVPTVVITLFLEKKYTVETTLMPPETQQDFGLASAGMGLSDLTGFFSGGMGFSLPLMTTMSDVYQEILESRTLVEAVILSTGYIERSHLTEKYETDPQLGLYWARKMFRSNYSVSMTPSGFLKVEVTTGDPMYSVEVSERVVAVLDSINASISLSRAQLSREYLELRSASAESLLSSATVALRSFEQQHGIVLLDQEMSAFIGSLTSLKQKYMELLAQAGAIRSGIVGSSNASALLLEREAANLLGVIEMLETGVAPPGYEEMLPSVSIEAFPEIQFQYARLMADYDMSLQLASAISVSLQQAIIEESRENQPVRVLDPPMNPGWKSKPKRLFIWLEVFMVACLFLFGFLLARENYSRMKEEKPEDWSRWSRLLSEIRGDFTRKKGKTGS